MSTLVAQPAPMDSNENNGGSSSPTVPGSGSVSPQQQAAGAGAAASTWTPSPTAAPFYPSFTPFYVPGQPVVPQAQAQFYDPNMAAQWAAAYHQMMAHQQVQFAPVVPFPQQPQFVPAPSPRPGPPGPPGQDGAQGSYQGFHPYRRPGRQNTGPDSSAPSTPPTQAHHPAWQQHQQQQFQQQPVFHPPYARAEASSSQTSLGGSSTSSKHRARVGSNNSSPSSRGQPASEPRHVPKPSVGRASPVPTAAAPAAPPSRAPHQRVNSSGSERSATSSSRVPPQRSASPAPAQPQARPSAAPAKPSPLSQGQSMSAVEKRMSRDDSELLVSSSQQVVPPSSGRPGGLKGRLRRAFSLNPAGTLDATAPAGTTANGISAVDDDKRTKEKPGKAPVADPDAPGAPPKRSRAASLFNPRFNRSTDNISLSSTVSSASVMIRKLGSMGKLARRNTLAGITNIFKDKDKKDGVPAKSSAEPTVSLATAEFDRTFAAPSTSTDPAMAGLSPAAQLARAHTLRSNAQDAAERAKAALERRNNNSSISSTSSRGSSSSGGRHIYEDGRKIIVEDDEDSGSDTDRGHRSDDDDDEDVTLRLNNVSVIDEDELEDEEAWAVGMRRSLERTREPVKGIIKNAVNFDQDVYLNSVLNASKPATLNQRPRSNSYAPVSQQPEPGPFSHIPSPDPDHIDGLHTHKENGTVHSHSLPRFSFEFKGEIPMISSSPEPSPPPSSSGHGKDRESIHEGKSPYQQPTFNSSAPVLSLGVTNTAHIAHRSATVPAKKISFAPNLSIYDTFSATTYDRRSEPATCNRLTPALAQRIKEELNSYKMEEMEVHVASRIHTHFFV